MSRQLSQVYHNLATMLDAGLPIMRALQTCASGLRGRLAGVFEQIGVAVKAGEDISHCMQSWPGLFAPLDVVVVRAGEQSGSLPDAFRQLADWYDFCLRIRQIIKSGMVLPILVLHFGALIGPLPRLVLGQVSLPEYGMAVLSILLLFYVPLMTFLVLNSLRPGRLGRRLLSGFPGLGPAVESVFFSMDSPLRRLFDAVLLRIWILGKAVEQLCLSRFARVFYILYDAGVPAARTMETACQIAGNAAIYHRLIGGLDAVKSGDPISSGFKSGLPLEFVNLWQVGEETGDLDDVTERLARMTGENAEMLLAELARWLPRIIYFIVMLIMAFQIIRGAMAIMQASGLGGM